MDADYDICEIVKVIPNFRLLDPEGYQRDYCTKQGELLPLGYYVVSWPETIRLRRFDKHAIFHGPYTLRKEADVFLKTMQKHNFTLIVASSIRALNVQGVEQVKAQKVA